LIWVALATGALVADSFVALRKHTLGMKLTAVSECVCSLLLHSSPAPFRHSRNGPLPLAHGRWSLTRSSRFANTPSCTELTALPKCVCSSLLHSSPAPSDARVTDADRSPRALCLIARGRFAAQASMRATEPRFRPMWQGGWEAASESPCENTSGAGAGVD
jgi:hypothetical protein